MIYGSVCALFFLIIFLDRASFIADLGAYQVLINHDIRGVLWSLPSHGPAKFELTKPPSLVMQSRKAKFA